MKHPSDPTVLRHVPRRELKNLKFTSMFEVMYWPRGWVVMGVAVLR